MSLLVDNIDYNRALRTIRELVLDTNPVQCFKVSGQDFLFKKDSSGFGLDTDTYTFSELEKFYDLMSILRDKKVTISILPDFVATEYCSLTENFNYPSIQEEKAVYRKNYFSDELIERVMEEFFAYYSPYDGIPKTVRTIYGGLDYFNRRKLIFWVAYYLVDRKRMNYASAGEMIRLNSDDGNGGEICGTEGELKSIDTTITTRVGEVFSVTERISDDGSGTEGFTSYWGDKYSYFTKLQLWIRDRFEKQFKDFSLRDDAMISQTFSLEKGWEPSAWVDTINFTRDTYDILQPDNRVPK